MGIVRKAVIGSLIVGLGAVAMTQNKKTTVKIRKNVTRMAKKVAHKTKSIVHKVKKAAVGATP